MSLEKRIPPFFVFNKTTKEGCRDTYIHTRFCVMLMDTIERITGASVGYAAVSAVGFITDKPKYDYIYNGKKEAGVYA
jgi:hypothetical protein